jgi:lipoprotein-anchoring transpeptidase ErfK/SrfK
MSQKPSVATPVLVAHSVSLTHKMQGNRRYLVAAAATTLLPACASTSIASTAPDPVRVVTTTTVDPSAEPDGVITTQPPATAPPTTTLPVEITVPIEPTEPPATTTTTIPPNQVAVPAADPPVVGVGTRDGAETARAQERLLELGFWLGAADGDYGLTTKQAVMAFQKYYGLATDGVLGDETAAVMSAITERPHGHADAGTLIEIDKSLQLLMFVVDGKTEWILNTSTGNEIPYDEPDKNTPGARQTGDSITRNGLHDVYRQRAEGWWEGDLGEIYRPKYFSGGEAVHGSNHLPDYPASHGCVRVSVPAMDWIWATDAMPLEMPVWVHGAIPGK